MTTPRYEQVSPESPCEICEKPDWCWRSCDGALSYCRRECRDDGVEREDKNGEAFYLHRKRGAGDLTQVTLPDVSDRMPRADVVVLDRVYETLLRYLTLSPEHHENLRARGLSDESIRRGVYATLSADPELRHKAIAAVGAVTGNTDVCGVPGFFRRKEDAGIELAGLPGLLIPVRDVEGRICAVRIRPDNPPLGRDGKVRGKYRFLSAPQGTIGCGPGAPVHVPLHTRAQRHRVRITEGELKAAIATERTDMLTISIPGAAAFAPSVAVARELGVTAVVLAYDADARRNKHVAMAVQRCAQLFAQEFGSHGVGVEDWPEDAGKGIDDLLTGGRPGDLQQHWSGAAWAKIAEIAQAAGACVDPTIEARIALRDLDERLQADHLKTAFAPDVLRAAGVLCRTAKAEYELLTSRMKKAKVRLREWERAVRKTCLDAPRDLHTDRRLLPVIEVRVDEAAVATEAMAALATSTNIFQRGGSLVHVIRDGGMVAAITRPPGSPRIVVIPPALLRERCSASARWCQIQTDSEGNTKLVETHPPQWAVNALHQRGQWEGILQLEGAVEWPVLRPDGSVLTTPGYDAATGLLFAPNCPVPSIPDLPTAADVDAAIALLREVICDFPFATPAHESAFLAALLTPFARFAFHGPSPLMLIDKNAAGAGGSKLVDVVSAITGGRDMARMSPSPTDEEERKRITSLAISGATMVLIDNVSKALGTPSLDAALTATEWQDRILGASVVVKLPLLVTWYATGNNITLAGDTFRRCLHIRIETEDEHPERREGFKHDPLLPWVREQRPEIMAAALTVLRAYTVAGRPDQGLPSWGSFEGWSGLVRASLVWAGLPDPGETRIELQADADDTAGALVGLVAGWEEVAASFGGSCTVAQVLAVLEEDYEKKRFSTLREALDEMVPRPPGQLPSARQVGNALKRFRGRVAGGKALVKAGARGEGGNVWTVRVTASAQAAPSPSAPPRSRPRPTAASPVAAVSGLEGPSISSNTTLPGGGKRSTVRGKAAGAEADAADAADAATGGATTAWVERL